MSTLPEAQDRADLFWDTDVHEDASSTTSLTETLAHDELVKTLPPALSLFESIVTTYPPILESLLDQIPTAAVLNLYHTSRYLRDFLRGYPLAWRTLSFRLPQPAVVVGSPGNETPDSRERQSKAYSFDALLKQIILPYGTRLTSLDVCNTAVSGIALVGSVLAPRIDSLQHLSVRGCKNVSIKYHIVPFLEPYTVKLSPWVQKDLALKSLYTYRCRHHRRRPYLPSSLIRRDSDSDPTHQLIERCHQLGIWTDTAWCPTPGGRCFRRKDYHAGRAGPQNMEVWVPFDRLWRSSNRLGPSDAENKLGAADGRLWEINETGQDGEPLGTVDGQFKGEGKHVPAHLRSSHRIFIEDMSCAQCNEVITERCESCSVRMHCMGCRKTLCASCAFNRPIPRKRKKTRHFQNLAFGPGATLGSTLSQASGSSTSLAEQSRVAKEPSTNRFWWAPGATRSPNLMSETAQDDDSSDSEDGGNMNNGLPLPPANRDPPKLNMHWCCLEPIFSGGGGIAVLGTGLAGKGADKIRAAPLPRRKEFEDPDFSNQLRPVDYIRELKNNGLYEYVLGEDVDVLSYLKQDSLDLQAVTCPRGLCQDCYRSFRWKVTCRTCKNPLCKEHDFRALKFRKCGYRDMHTEREYARSHNNVETPRLVIPEFNPKRASSQDPERTPIANALAPTISSSSSSITGHLLDAPEAAPLSQSEILAPPAPSATEMSPSPSSSSHRSTADLFPGPSTLPFVPVSLSRPRSFSASGIRGRNSVSWQNSSRAPLNPITNPPPLPCHGRHPVQWEGCGAYFCQFPRPAGDNRSQCPAILKECSDCAVLVCDSCVAVNPTCTCTFCTVNYHCPHCTTKPEIKAQCRLEEELKAKALAEQRAREKMEQEKEDRGKADKVAGAAYEFWTLMGEVMEEIATLDLEISGAADMHHLHLAELPVELPVPSPDSITVTTEFGVQEEPSNVTTIFSTASHAMAPMVVQTEDIGMLQEAQEAVIEEVENMELPHNTTAPPIALELEVEVPAEDMADDMADDEEVEMEMEGGESEDFDAEGELIDEFIEEIGLHG